MRPSETNGTSESSGNAIGDKVNTIICGDCIEEMKKLPDNSIDSIVTDPPYGWSFMGKKWDYDVPTVDVWKEVLRVLKPGSHILVACGTRTQHRMAINIEDAGFEIRDLVAWVYGSGFPKSLNVGKAVDKLQGNERETTQFRTDGRGKWELKMNREKGDTGVGHADGSHQKYYETKGNSIWEGWGTALKPAMELWTLARKPLSEKIIVENVLKWGTGGLNVDGCRIETRDGLKGGVKPGTAQKGWERPFMSDDESLKRWEENKKRNQAKSEKLGRFPANLIHDGSDEVVKLFPDSNGQQGDVKGHEPSRIGDNEIYGHFNDRGSFTKRNDIGSAARFFYCAKASKEERNKGLNGFEKKQQDESRKEGNPGRDNPRNRGVKQRANFHPTVKPISLMRYLCRMITPPNGIVLDPFIGSGTTAIGAKLEGFSFIGIECEPKYVEIAEARIKSYSLHKRLDKFIDTKT